MMSLNDNEKNFQKKLQEKTEIPVIVHERVNQAYRLIENNTAVQKKAPKEPYHWMKIGGRIAGGMAAVLAVGFIFCAVNPVMAKNLPVVGGLFEILQDNVSFSGISRIVQRLWKSLIQLRQIQKEIHRKILRRDRIRQKMTPHIPRRQMV